MYYYASYPYYNHDEVIGRRIADIVCGISKCVCRIYEKWRTRKPAKIKIPNKIDIIIEQHASCYEHKPQIITNKYNTHRRQKAAMTMMMGYQ